MGIAKVILDLWDMADAMHAKHISRFGEGSASKKSVTLWEAVVHMKRMDAENAAFRRIMADQLRRGGCPDDLIAEAIDKAVREA